MKSRLVLLGVFACLGAKQVQAAGPPSVLQAVQSAATLAHQNCQGLIQQETYEFSFCVLDLIRKEKAPSPKRLGFEYRGWVSSLDAYRRALPGSEPSSYEFLRRFRSTQARLRLSDAQLCATVEGDCKARLAHQAEMERSAKKMGGSTPHLPRRENQDW